MSRRLGRLARPYALTYLAGFLLLLITNGLGLWIPWLLRDAIDAMDSGAALQLLARYSGAIVIIALMAAVVRTISRWIVLGSSRRIAFDMRNRFFRHLERMGASFYDSHRTGDIMSRGVNDIQLLQSVFGPGALNLLNTSIVYTAVLVLMLRIDALLTLVSLAIYPVLLFGVNRLSKRVYTRSKAVQEQLAAISNQTQENISGIQQVKTYVQEDREIAAFRDLCAEFRRRNVALAALRGGMVSLIGVLTGVGTLIVLFLGGRHVIEGRITFGDFVAFNAYLALLVWPTIALGWIINTFQRGLGAMERLDELLRQRPDIPPAVDEARPAGPPREPVDGDIEIRGLTFAYRGRGETAGPALQDVHLTLPRGSRVALVGAVGSGKSTLANLLARVYPAPPGSIFIGGVDINELPVSRLRGSVGYVPQEAFLFSRSLRDNVAFGRPDAAEEQIAAALDTAQLAVDLANLPKGLDTVVGERGFTLSGGQRQRATLARAVIVEPRILILDDSLSSIDADTERSVLNRLETTMRDRTTILITHRPSTLAAMDRIIVFSQGRVVEDGTHDELLERKGEYAQLFRRHMLRERLESA